MCLANFTVTCQVVKMHTKHRYKAFCNDFSIVKKIDHLYYVQQEVKLLTISGLHRA